MRQQLKIKIQVYAKQKHYKLTIQQTTAVEGQPSVACVNARIRFIGWLTNSLIK